jgi:hypothetical protein
VAVAGEEGGAEEGGRGEGGGVGRGEVGELMMMMRIWVELASLNSPCVHVCVCAGNWSSVF